MKRTTMSIAMFAASLAAPTYADGQTTSLIPTGSSVATVITFEMQLNLTNLSPDLQRVRLGCMIQSPSYSWTPPAAGSFDAITQFPGAELYVVQGKAAGTLSVPVPIATAYLAPDALGKQASYMCFLVGYSTSLQRWDALSENQTNATFRLNAAPPNLMGSFVW